MVKIAVIAGSHRENSQSERIGRYLVEDIAKRGGVTSELISLARNPLPLWDEGMWGTDPKWEERWGPISKQLSLADAVIVIAPEWAGMVPAGLKNLFLLCSKHELAHKPGMIVGVSSGIGGSYPVSELRASSYKNSRLCYIPDHIIVRSAEKMLHGEVPADSHDESLRARITYTVSVLIEYARALRTVRESGVIDLKSFPYGM